MQRHIFIFELVAKAGRSGEPGISDQLNKTQVEVNLDVSWWTLCQTDGLWHKWSGWIKDSMNNYTFPLSVTPHSPGYMYMSFSIKALTCSLHLSLMPSWNIWSDATECTLPWWCERRLITWNEPLTVMKAYSYVNKDTYPFTNDFNKVIIPCNVLLNILVLFILPNEWLDCI